MFRSGHHLPGTPPATLTRPKDIAPGPPDVTVIEYDRDSFSERKLSHPDELFEDPGTGGVRWINVDGLGDPGFLERLGKHFNLHPLAIEDALNTAQRPKCETYDNHLFVVAQMIYLETGEDPSVLSEQVSLFLRDKLLITIQEEPGQDVFDPVRQRLRQGRGNARGHGSDYLAYMLLDSLIDHFFPVLEVVGDNIESLEEEMLDHPGKDALRRLYGMKRILMQLRRSAWPQREVIGGLHRDDSGLVGDHVKVFFRDCYDHVVQIIDIIESDRDLTAGMMDLYLSSVGMRTNEIIRVLTVISAVFIPLTFLAGLYGMNFNTEAGPWNMPELHWRYGYPALLVAMIGIAAAMLLFFKRKRWL